MWKNCKNFEIWKTLLKFGKNLELGKIWQFGESLEIWKKFENLENLWEKLEIWKKI